MFTRILVPMDFSRSSAAALELVRKRFPEAQCLLLHVLDPRQLAGSLTSTVSPSDQKTELEIRVRDWLTDFSHEGDEITIATGQPAEVIIAEAERWQAELIVMGTHGRTGIDHFLNGSVAERVVRRSRLPVLIEHERSAADE